jgi:hypothetical protein
MGTLLTVATAVTAFGWGTAVARTAAPAVTALGYFDASSSDGEHRTGYALELWRSDGSLVGFLLVPRGPEGDPPTGRLEHVELDAEGNLSFTAKVPAGWAAPDKIVVDEYHFHGRLAGDKVQGTMERSARTPNEVVPLERVTFRRDADMTQIMGDYSTLAQWEEHAARILKRRGPPRQGQLGSR